MKQHLFNVYQRIMKTCEGYGLGRNMMIYKAHAVVKSFVRPDYVRINGHKMYLDKNDTLNLATRKTFEPYETEVLLSKIKKGQTIVDIGANIGYYTLLFARAVGGAGKVYAFEPDPNNFRILKKNIEANGYNNVILENKAVADKKGRMKLYLNPDNLGDHKIYDDGKHHNYVEIDAVSLNDYFGDDEHIDLMKIDIQGAEISALRGMNKILPNVDVIVSEYWPYGITRMGMNTKEYFDILTKKGFAATEINERKHILETADIDRLISMKPKLMNDANLIWSRTEY